MECDYASGMKMYNIKDERDKYHYSGKCEVTY